MDTQGSIGDTRPAGRVQKRIRMKTGVWAFYAEKEQLLVLGEIIVFSSGLGGAICSGGRRI